MTVRLIASDIDGTLLRDIALAPANTLEGDLEDLLLEPMVKLIAKHPLLSSRELHAAAHAAIKELTEIATATDSSGSLVELSAVGITKAFALERVATEHGIVATEVVAFGDMPNDIPMLSWAGRGVATGNAHPDVLASPPR